MSEANACCIPLRCSPEAVNCEVRQQYQIASQTLEDSLTLRYRHRYWLNANPDDPVAFRTQVKYICSLHLKAKELLAQGIPESQY